MEEILASIRRIISEDDAPPADGDAAEAAPAPAPVDEVVAAEPEPEPAPIPAPVEPEDDDDVLELTETVAADDEISTVGDLDVYTPPKAAAEPEPAWEPEPEPVAAAPEPAPAPSYAAVSTALTGGMTIEELVRSILEPKLHEWADQNLDSIVRSILREKLDRVFR